MRKLNEFDLSKTTDLINFREQLCVLLNNNLFDAKEMYGENLTSEDLLDYVLLLEEEDVMTINQNNEAVFTAEYWLKNDYICP